MNRNSIYIVSLSTDQLSRKSYHPIYQNCFYLEGVARLCAVSFRNSKNNSSNSASLPICFKYGANFLRSKVIF